MSWPLPRSVCSSQACLVTVYTVTLSFALTLVWSDLEFAAGTGPPYRLIGDSLVQASSQTCKLFVQTSVGLAGSWHVSVVML